ncbi:MAG: CsgG/HfaB family protein [Candidatus Sericytochromatia bacterium]
MRYFVLFSLLLQILVLPVSAATQAVTSAATHTSTLAEPASLQVSYQNQQGLAVLNLKTQGNVPAEMGQILTDRIRALVIKSRQYRVMERSQMEAIIKEQGFQASMQDCDSVACAIELGKLLSVRQLMIGSLSQVGQVYSLNLRIIDTQSGQIINERFADCRCSLEDVLMQVSPSLVQALISGETPAIAPALNASYKEPVTVFLLNLPGPFGYFYMEEWGWFGGLLAVDIIAAIALIVNQWSFPGGELTAWLALAATRIFGVIHGPALANERNRAIKTAQQELPAQAQTLPLLQMTWQF